MTTLAVVLMVTGTIADLDWVARWAFLAGLLAVGMWIGAAVRVAAEGIKSYIRIWSLETFEHGIKQGIDLGREMEAADRLIASAWDLE